MKFIPILYQTLMVQAILDGRKTMTRRTKGLDKVNERPDDWDLINYFKSDFGESITFQFVSRSAVALIKCPYGKTGDVLWVRESFNYFGSLDPGYLSYKATYPNDLPGGIENVPEVCDVAFKPSIHMPKTACRIFLQIENITVERLQDISEEDAIAEGIEKDCSEGPCYYKNYNELTRLYEFEFSDSRNSFESLWQKINGPASWDANPWVWVISFKKIDKPDGFLPS